MAKMKTTKFEDFLDEELGKKGSFERDSFEMEVDSRIIGEKIRALRKARGWTQTDAGLKIGVGKSRIARIEKGDNNITLVTYNKVMSAFGLIATMNVRKAKKGYKQSELV